MRRAGWAIGLLGVALVAGIGLMRYSAGPQPAAPQRDAVEPDVEEQEGPIPVRPLAQGKPNVILIIACTLRRDQLTPYGGPEQTSPFLEQLADRGTRFAHAVDSAPWTRPASTAVLTGRHAIEVGMVEPEVKLNRRRLSGQVITVAERLHDAGFETFGLTANPNLNRVFGFDQGFDAYHESQELWAENDVVKVSSAELVLRALDLVDERQQPDAPLYLQLLTIDTHEPIEVGARRAKALMRDGVPHRVGAYRVEVQRWDLGLKNLWMGLNHRGYTEQNTILMVVNDHGEGLSWPPEHGMGHGNFLMPSAVDMPWIVHGHSVALGHVVGGMASQVDVHPTLMGLVGVEGYEGPGRDWSAQVRGESDRTERERAYVDTWFVRASRAAVYTETRFCMHDFFDLPEQLGVERRLPRTACFDRRIDPNVRDPLPKLDQPLLDDLFAWREQMWSAYEAWPHHESINEDDPVLQQLEELGYVDD
ncbi:MAG: sulfatase-like hydrolase/transferase [Myxococcales bacterium]|nr:sulfatase-like hydrolase/transferase [Myxococcales bacterium]